MSKTKKAPPISPDVVDKILDMIASGESVRFSCKECGAKRSTFRMMVREDQELSARYARARQDCADAHFESIEELERKVMSGEIGHAEYRAVMDSMKWRLARMKPQAYGDVKTVNHMSPDGSMSPTRIELVPVEPDGRDED